MNKSALKRFATEARTELLERIELQARKIGITAESIQQASVESSDAVFIDGRQLSDAERKQRNKLIARIDDIGFTRVIDEAAYTWFNRFIALRFMEVNDYLPTKVRVLSSTNEDSPEPDMMREAMSLDVELDREYVYDLKIENKTDELFKYLIKVHCNDLNRYMPFMFETVEDYSEILFPEGLLGTDSFVRKMTDTDVIAEEDWENIEIVGWLYQYYITEENERVIRAKKRYKPNEIPYATQLFTPDWIVRYIVQNALGRYWVESHPEQRDLIQNWEFFLESQNLEEDSEEKLAPYINKELNVEDIKCFDPAMGSGHILVYMFDVLHEIYSKCGYMEREIPRLIIEKNLYGLDIDNRAFQMASFAVVMKAMQYNKRFLRNIERQGLTMNLSPIQETNSFNEDDIIFLAGEASGERFNKMKTFIEQFEDAKSIGSLIKIESYDSAFLEQRLKEIKEQPLDLFEYELTEQKLPLFTSLINQAKIMDGEYDVFITNPPYAGNKYVTPEVSAYLNKHYPTVKSDLFSAFMLYSTFATKENGQMGFMTPFVWMFISSYEKLRKEIIDNRMISTLIQLEYSGFDSATVPICTFTLRNYNPNLSGEYVRLSDFRGAENQPLKTLEAVNDVNVKYRYSFEQKNYNRIPGSPIAYWVSKKVMTIFEIAEPLEMIANPKKGLTTARDAEYLRSWSEVSYEKISFDSQNQEIAETSGCKWFPLNKGGDYRKWYGNNEYVLNWENNGDSLRKFEKSVIRNESYYFNKCISWNDITSSKVSFRYKEKGQIFNDAGPSIFGSYNDLIYLLGFGNSVVSREICKLIAPTIHYGVGQIAKLPILNSTEYREMVIHLVEQNIKIAKEDWDSRESSWGFQAHPLIKIDDRTVSLSESFGEWESYTDVQFGVMMQNEIKLDEIFVDIYDLQNVFQTIVDEKDITYSKANLERDLKSFISYAIGCSFGRYSLDEEGLIYAGGEFDSSRYTTFPADEDNIIPILPGAYFEDDIVTRFVDFVRITFSAETLEENLNFVADALGRRKNETARETLRRYFLNDFYKDHVQVYKKRPIYWLFTSGKEKAFNCLIYMHRYDKTTLSRIRTDYLHEVQTRLDVEKQDLLSVIEDVEAAKKEISDAKKELKSVDKKIDELRKYDELLHHMADQQIEFDLDDGVKVNYALFDGLVGKI